MNEWTIYWITRLDGLHGLLFGLTLTSVAVLIALGMLALNAALDGYPDTSKAFFKWALVPVVLTNFFCAAGVFVPTTKDALIIYGVPKLIASQEGAIKQAGEVPEKLLKVLNGYLDEQLEARGAQ